jgi:hypothetical protein
MGTRTIVEFNHDAFHKLRDRPELLREIVDELATSHHNAALNEANSRGRALYIGHGVRIIMQRQYDTDCTVRTKYAEVKL